MTATTPNRFILLYPYSFAPPPLTFLTFSRFHTHTPYLNSENLPCLSILHFPMPRSCDATAAPRGMRLLRDEQSYVTVRYRCRRHWAKKQQPRASNSYRKFRENAAPANLAPEASSGTQSNPSRITDDLYTARTHCARCRCGRNS